MYFVITFSLLCILQVIHLDIIGRQVDNDPESLWAMEKFIVFLILYLAGSAGVFAAHTLGTIQ